MLLAFIVYINKNKNNNIGNLYNNNNIGYPDNNNISPNDNVIENFNMDKILYDDPLIKDKAEDIKFNYENMPTKEDEQFKVEQEKGMNLATRYFNHYIKYIDENNEPVYNIDEKQNNIVENKVQDTWEFNKPKVSNIDGYVNNNTDGYVNNNTNVYVNNNTDGYINNNTNGYVNNNTNGYVNKTVREVFDNSFVDYKKLVPKKDLVQNINKSSGASSLTFYKPDKWTYNNEKMENGGEIVNGLYACDPSTIGSVAIF